MKFKIIHKSALVMLAALLAAGVAGVVLFSPESAVSTTEYMLRLPAYSKFSCTICHKTSSPIPNYAPLNAFGEDFRDNGYIWNRTLAMKNSDGDKCPNGFELGDMNGDGILDELGSSEHSNPGQQDCTITLTRQTWGIIKEIFSSP